MNMVVGILFDTRFNFSEHNKSIIQTTTTTTTEATKTKKVTATGLLGKLHHVLMVPSLITIHSSFVKTHLG